MAFIPNLFLKYQGKNEYFINGDTAELVLYDLNGFEKDRVVIDSEDVERCAKVRWSSCINGYVGSYRYLGIGKRDLFTTLPNFLINFKSTREIHIDHKDRDKANNRKSNFRICTRQQNLMNNSQKVGKTGYRGVYPLSGNRFRAKIRHNGRLRQIGSFSTAIEAAKAWNEKALGLRGEFAVLNPV